MNLQETIKATPISTQRSLRRDTKRVLTSAKAGKIIPLAYVPLLREDRVASSRMRVNLEMMETAEMLMNAVNVTVFAHFIPYLASDRFIDMGQLNRAYMGKPEPDNNVTPFIHQMAFNKTDEFWKTMGIHAKAGAMVNSFPVEAYNILVNHRRQARSKNLPLRTPYDTTLATAFWNHNGMNHIVPDFDQAMIDGEVELNIASALLPVRGLGLESAASFPISNISVKETTGQTTFVSANEADAIGTHGLIIEEDPANPGFPGIFAELQQQNVKVSLANIELAKQTAAFARLRKQYQGLSDDHIIDLLMEGIRVPEEAMSQPILLDRKKTIMGYNRRYATDAANLAESVTNGETFVDLTMRTPPMNTGGIILITAEVVPEQLFERQHDYYLHASGVGDFPNFTADFLDPEKVAIVPNKHVDVEHSDPDGTFGYAPLNHQWKRNHVNLGGKYLRPDVDAAFDEDRQKFWAVETPDPALTADFYLASQLHNKIFADTTSDPLEISVVGEFAIVGNTVFGKGLMEASDDYSVIEGKVDTARIDQTAQP